MKVRWEHILGAALDHLEERPGELDRARETLQQLRGVAAVSVEALAGEPFDSRAEFDGKSERLFQRGELTGYTGVGVETIGGPPLWIAPLSWTLLAQDLGLQINATGPAIGTGTVREIEIYDADYEPFMVIPLDIARFLMPGDQLKIGDIPDALSPARTLFDDSRGWDYP